MSHPPYRCGLRPRQRVRLRKDLIIRDHRGRATGKVHSKGEIWTVLPDSCSFHHDRWLQQPDGRPHTWDDDEQSVSEWFEATTEDPQDLQLSRVPFWATYGPEHGLPADLFGGDFRIAYERGGRC